MKYILIGCLFTLLGVMGGTFIWGVEMVPTITGGIGEFFLGVACLLSGVFVNGDRLRANLATESDDDRVQRNNRSLQSFLIGLPSIVVALLFYFN